ncbi:MAG: DNA repair protein RadC [Candidatus Fermentibacteraceae bacterium]|nr:DNA repair protein RadC [Candidatus Fermentibacteraceae bacterium]MBN2608769.1 DNA repair protein RadC [Candidatus Fermentibacteraceae bacterium]
MTVPKEGHRERLRTRYLQGGIRGFSDRDALELLLTYAVPRRDTRKMAHLLLEKFGTLHGVLSQPPAMLQTVPGIGPAAGVLLNLVTAVSSRALRPEKGARIIDSPEKVREYLQVTLGTQRREKLMALLLDSSNRLIAECVLEYGTVDRASVHPRNLLEKVIATGATAVILVHNHPGGAMKASQEDINLTRRLSELGRSLGFRVLDHMIVADGETLSLREEGLFT